jgi:multidrug resistance efflux pump
VAVEILAIFYVGTRARKQGPQISSRISAASSSTITKTMDVANASAEALRRQISETEAQLQRLKAQLAQVEADGPVHWGNGLSFSDEADNVIAEQKWPLSAEEYRRYGRQMIVPSLGIQG